MTEPPTIEFPCSYPIKVITVHDADKADEQLEIVLDIVRIHASPIDWEQLTLRPSRNDNYRSIGFDIIATGESQISALHQALVALSFVKLVL